MLFLRAINPLYETFYREFNISISGNFASSLGAAPASSLSTLLFAQLLLLLLSLYCGLIGSSSQK
jgi:hypothetical protein